MTPLATIGNLIEVMPSEELQYFIGKGRACEFVDDRTPFRFRVDGELMDDGFFFGLYGSVVSGHERYLNLTCNIVLRYDNSDWQNTSECGASFKVAPSIAKRVANYDAAEHCDVPFFLHPDGTSTEGYPKMSRFGEVRVVTNRK